MNKEEIVAYIQTRIAKLEERHKNYALSSWNSNILDGIDSRIGELEDLLAAITR